MSSSDAPGCRTPASLSDVRSNPGLHLSRPERQEDRHRTRRNLPGRPFRGMAPGNRKAAGGFWIRRKPTPETAFVVEGAVDALSAMRAGGSMSSSPTPALRPGFLNGSWASGSAPSSAAMTAILSAIAPRDASRCRTRKSRACGRKPARAGTRSSRNGRMGPARIGRWPSGGRAAAVGCGLEEDRSRCRNPRKARMNINTGAKPVREAATPSESVTGTIARSELAQFIRRGSRHARIVAECRKTGPRARTAPNRHGNERGK